MGRQVNWDDVPDVGQLLPKGIYVLSIADIEERSTNINPETGIGGKLMYSPEFRVVEPADFADSPLYDNFVIGTDDDPEAGMEETWQKSFGSRRFKQLIKMANVPADSDIDNVIASLRDQQVVADVDVEEDTDEASKYYGRKQNRIRGFYQLGTRQPVVQEQPKQISAPVMRAAPARAAAPQPRPAAQATPQPAPRPVPGAAAPVQAPAPARAPTRTQPAPRPNGPTPAAAGTAVPTAKRPASQMVQCSECGEKVPRAEFPQHIETCGQEA